MTPTSPVPSPSGVRLSHPKLDVEGRICDQMADSLLLQALVDLLPDKAKIALYDRLTSMQLSAAHALAARPDLARLVQDLLDAKVARILNTEKAGSDLWAL